MSNRRRPSSVPALCLAGMVGQRLPGGCDDCDAYQTLERQPNDAWGGVYVLTVHHDDGCPFLSGATR